jgi:tetratricopeptide (TPR) repeat protein
VSEERVQRFAEVAEAKASAQAAGALGWREYRAQRYDVAIDWFDKALRWLPAGKADAKIAEGYALSLRASGKLVEAEDFAWTHRALSLELRKAYVAAFSDQLLDPKLSPHLPPLRLERFAEVVRADKISSGASALGWRRLQDGNCGYSLGWFRKAVAWSEGGLGDSKMYSGLAQGLRAVGMYNEAEDAAYAYADRDPEARALYTNIGVEELTRVWPRVPMTETRIARFTAVVDKDHSSKGAQALGWKRYMTAGCGYGGRWFERAASWSDDKRGDAHLSEGYALSLRSVGRLARAETVAAPWIDRAPSMKKLFIDVAVEALSRDNPPEPLAETRIAGFETVFTANQSALGAQALGWYRFARGENEASARWFRLALDWWPARRPDADQKLTAPADDYHALLAHLALRIEDYRRTPHAYPNSSLLIGHDTQSYVDSDLGLAKTTEGYVRALAALGRYADAEELGFAWADRWSPLRGVMIDMASAALSGAGVSDDRVARYQKLIEDARSPAGAQAFGWRAYKVKDYEGATRWFKLSIDWRPTDAPMSLDIARAYADSLSQLKQYDAALAFVAQWRDKMPDLAAAGLDIGAARLATLDPASTAAETAARTLAADVSAAHSASGAQSLGWLAYNRKEYDGAQAWFRKAIQWAPAGADPDSQALEGFARTLQGQGRFDDFLRFAEMWSERVEALKPLYLEAAAQSFAASAASGQPIPTDRLARAGKVFAQARFASGAQALAWQRVSQKDFVAAAAWFRASLDWAKERDPKTVEGLVISLRALHKDDDAENLAYQESARDPALRSLYIETVADRLTRKPPAPPNQEGVRRFADVVLASSSASGAQALAWYSFNARQYAVAAAWFEKAVAFEPSENAALGLAAAYRKLNDRDNYERVVKTYRDTYGKIAELGGASGAPHERRAAFESGEAPARAFRQSIGRSAAAPAAGSALTLGWKMLHQNRPAEAAQAFEAAMQGSTGRARHDAAYGESLALMSAGDSTKAASVAGSAELDAKQRNDIGTQMLEQRAWAAYNADRYVEALAWLQRRAAFMPETRDLRQMRVYCLQKLNRMEEAQKVQEELDQQLSR